MNKISKKTLLGLFLLVSLQTMAQSRYCTSFDDYLEGNWTELPTLAVSINSKSEKKKKEEAALDYTFTTNDKAIDKKLKKEAFIIQCGDSMFISLRNLRHENSQFANNFARAYPLPDNKILFTSRRAFKSKNMLYASFGAAGAVVGGVPVNLKIDQKTPHCFIVENIDLGSYIPTKIIDDDLITKVLKNHDDLIDEYFSEEKKKKRETSEHILPLLKRAGIIE